MSLINEALKRAEREKRRRRSESEHPDIPPVPEPQRRSSAPSILSASVVIVLVIAIGAGVVFFLSRSTTPSAAVASIAPIAPQITPQVQPKAKPAKLVIIKTQEALDYYEPAKPAKQYRSGTDLLTKRLLASAAHGIGGYLKTAQTRLNHQARLLPSRTSPGGSSGRSDQAHATTQRATIADTEVAQRTGANLDPTAFKISGIIHGPSGPRAIINGCMVRVGQRITNATVVQINVHSVELQRGSQRITISM